MFDVFVPADERNPIETDQLIEMAGPPASSGGVAALEFGLNTNSAADGSAIRIIDTGGLNSERWIRADLLQICCSREWTLRPSRSSCNLLPINYLLMTPASPLFGSMNRELNSSFHQTLLLVYRTLY